MIRRPLPSRVLWLVAAFWAASCLAPFALAQFIQTGAGPFDYNTAANWNGGSITGVFSQTPTVAQSITFNANSILTTGLTFSLGGTPTVTLSGDGTDRTITLGGDVSVSGSTTSVAFGSTTSGLKLNLDLGGTDRTVSVATGNLLYVNNVISGANALTKTGAGQLTLAGANTYSGTTTVNGGTLLLNATGVLNSGNNVVINSTTAASTALLNLGTGFTQAIGTLTLGGAGGAAASNNVTLNTGSTLTLGGTLTYDGTSAPLASTISGGTIALGANRTFAVADSTGTTTELNISSAITGSGLSLTKTGAGRLQLTGANTYDGGTVLNGGTLFIGATNALVSTAPVTVNDLLGGTAALGFNSGAGNNNTIGALTFGGAGATATSINNVSINASSLTLGGTVTYNATNGPLTATISALTTGSLALGGNRVFAVADSANTTAELNISAPITGSGFSLTKTGAGRLQLTGANTYDGGTILNGGTLFIGATNALVSTAPVTVNDLLGGTAALGFNSGSGNNNTIGTLTFGGAGATTTSINNVSINTSSLTLGGTVTFNATNNPAAATISASGTGSLDLGANRTFNIADSTTTTTELTISAPVTGTGFSLTKTGAGALRVTGANTYDGGTVVSAGGLVVANTTGSGVGTGAVTIASGAYLRGTGFAAGTYTLFDFTSAASVNSFDLADFTLGTTVSGYTSTLAISGNKLQLTAIPEPATYAAIFGGVSLLGAAIYRRRARRAFTCWASDRRRARTCRKRRAPSDPRTGEAAS